MLIVGKSMLQPRSPSEVDLGKSLVDATFEAGVQHLIYSGLASASKITDGAFPNRAFDGMYPPTATRAMT